MENLEQKIREIEERNKRVETDKAWETSWTRRLLLTLFTYLAIGIYLWVIEITRPWFNAIVPAVAFMLSTLTMPFLKKLWLKGHKAEDVEDFVQPTEDAPPQGRGLIEEKDFKRENLEKLRDYIKGKEQVNNNEVEEFLRVSDATATRYLDELEKERLLEQVGQIGQGVYYKVK